MIRNLTLAAVLLAPLPLAAQDLPSAPYLPLEMAVDPGYYRVVLHLEEGGVRVYSRNLSAGEETRVEALVRANDGPDIAIGQRLLLPTG